MPIEIIERAPKIRCYKCGKTQIQYICHHCGTPICSSHYIKRINKKEGILDNTEFTQLGLKEMKCGEEGIHCEKCYHTILGEDKSILGKAITNFSIGIILLILSIVINNIKE